MSELRGEGSIEVACFQHQTESIPDYDKAIYRMFEARQRRENSKKSLTSQGGRSYRE